MMIHSISKGSFLIQAICVLFGLMLFFFVPRSVSILQGQVYPIPSMDVGTTVTPTIELRLSEGSNQFGKRTILVGTSIDFGNVTFTHPELISNGDAYLEQGILKLEAVMNIGVTFGGANFVALDLSRIKISANSFRQTYYSLSTNRSDVSTVVFEDPERSRIKTLTASSTFPVRLVLEINPNQSGRISDRFRLEATVL